MRRDVALLMITASLAFATTASSRAAAVSQSQAEPAQDPEDAAVNAAGRATVEQVCTLCHDATMIEGGDRTPAEWDDVLERMAANGASASQEQAEQIRAYLLRNYGRANVNRAPARDLAPILNVEASVADAVVMYRTEQGAFTTIEDLKKVPGIDATKLEARKTRLIF